MAVRLFTDALEPSDHEAPIWRFVDARKFEDLLRSGELFFNRADLFPQDDEEGLPPEEYLPILGLDRYELRDAMKRNHHIAELAQDREDWFINCWHLFESETLGLWAKFGPIAVCSTYARLKTALGGLDDADEPHIGLVRYGWEHLTGWNVHRFVTTKRRQFSDEREVRAALWIRDMYAGRNRHFDENNFPHDRPLTPPPDRVKPFHRRRVDLDALVTGVVLGPLTTADDARKVHDVLRATGHGFRVRASDLAAGAAWLPTAEDVERYGR